MERIQQALSQHRTGKLSTRLSGGPGRRHSVGLTPEQVVYTQTRTVSPDPSGIARQRVLTQTENHAYIEAYKILRTQVLHRLHQEDWNVIGVTSPGASEGKTLVAGNLAISMAMERNHTAILVDGNIRNPSVHQLFGAENQGLADYLLDDVPFSELLIHPNIDRLVVMPGGGPVKDSAELLTLPKMTLLVQEMKSRYPSRVVIFDLPPLLDIADVLGLAPQMDAVLLVVEEGKTTQQQVEQCLHMVEGTLPLLGTVLNKAQS